MIIINLPSAPKPQISPQQQQQANPVPRLEWATERPSRSQTEAIAAVLAPASQPLDLPAPLLKALQALSQDCAVPLALLLLAAFKILLYRYTGQSTIAVGTLISQKLSPLAASPSHQTFPLNPRVFQTHLAADQSLQQVLIQVVQAAATAPLASPIALAALGQSGPAATPSGNALLQVMFAFQAQAAARIPLVEGWRAAAPTGVLAELALNLKETATGLQGSLEYDATVFLPETMQRMAGHWLMLLASLVKHPQMKLSALPLLPPAEFQQCLVAGQGRQIPVPSDRCLHDLFVDQAARTPEAIAVVAADQTLTYAELNTRTNQLARYLQNLGVGPDVLVGICLERSLDMVVSFLGVLKAGGAYVPLDPLYPQARRVYQLQDAQVPVILTQQHLRSCVPTDYAAQVVALDQDWAAIAAASPAPVATAVTPENLAYMLYTSGSTGNPKGVMVPHRGVVNHATAIAQEFQITPRDRMLQFSSMSFDIIIEELYPTLLNGATLVLRPEAIASSTRRFLEFIEQQQITILDLPTAFWHELVNGLISLDTQLPDHVRLLIVGGEKASLATYRQWRDHVGTHPRWLNTYGPTEATVSTTLYDPIAAQFDLNNGEIPIGKPIANAQVYVLDAHQQPVPMGLPGELYIGGPGLARGYLNLPEQTANRFIPDPFSPDPAARLYKTGDLVRYLANGTLEFVGRADFQVKIRGFRIELGEIETVLEQHPALQQAIVIAHETTPGNKILVAYILAAAAIAPEELRQFLRSTLPDYMIPTAFVQLDRLPLTANGKVDRRALPLPDIAPPATAAPPPQDDLEAQLIGLWQQVLGISTIGVNDNFFELGGHSLLAARLTDAIEQRLQQVLSATALFQAPTIAQLAHLLRRENGLTQPTGSAIVIQPGDPTVQPILFCIHVLGENCSFFRPLAAHMGADYPVYGLSAQMMDKRKAPPNQVEAIAEFYIREMRAIQPEGPYHLTGLSFGGTIAFEMARQLVAQGQRVDLLALLDTFGANLWESTNMTERLAHHFNYLLKMGPAYMLEKVQMRLESTKKKLLVKYGKLNRRLGRSLPYQLEFLMVLEENLQAADTYVTQFYPGKLTLFRAADNAVYSQAYLAAGLGWREWVAELDVQDTPGTHMTMVEEPHVAVLAAKFRASLKPVPAMVTTAAAGSSSR